MAEPITKIAAIPLGPSPNDEKSLLARTKQKNSLRIRHESFDKVKRA